MCIRDRAVARKDLDSAVFSGAKVREYESTLQALQTMGDALTGSLQKQWAMEQRQRERIIQLSHKLKTCLLYTSHIGTETRPRLLREAAVGNIAQWGKP